MTTALFGTPQSTFAGFEYLGKATRFAQEILEVIDHVSLFEEFSNQEFEALCDFMVCYTAPRHGVLIREGNFGDFLVILLTGKVNVVKQANDGSTKFIAAVGPGASLGEMSLIDGQARFSTCIATEPVDFAVLDRKALNDILVAQPRLGNKLLLLLLQLMAKRLRESGARLLPHMGSSMV